MRKNQHKHNGKIILMKIEDGDCIVFNSISAIMKDLNIVNNNYRSLNKLREHPRFKKKYIFFAMENDLLSNTFF